MYSSACPPRQRGAAAGEADRLSRGIGIKRNGLPGREQEPGGGLAQQIRRLSDNWLRGAVEFPILVGPLLLETLVKITYNYYDK